MNAAERIELFRCTALSCSITRAHCGARHELYAGKGNMREGTGAALGIASCVCRRCPIGEAHARGRRADVELVQVVAVAATRSVHVRTCAGCGDPMPPLPPGQHLRRASRVCSPACADVLADLKRRAEELSLPEWA